MMTGRKVLKALCHPDRPHLALSLCQRCYQKYKKNTLPEEFLSIVENHSETKSNLIFERHKDRINKRSKKLKGSSYIRNSTLKYRYGITEDVYQQMYENQNGKCYICNKEFDSSKLYIDHCHKNKTVRSLLCPKCNTFVGYIEKNEDLLPKIKDYLITYEQRQVGSDDRPEKNV